MQQEHTWQCRDRLLCYAERPLLMGILNVTPDSFSDGGRYRGVDAAVAHAEALVADGADIIDIGGESTRPGAAAVDTAEEIERVVPVIRKLAARVDVPISVDTMKSEVARAAVADGASIINDVTAGSHDPQMLKLAAESGCGLVLMHMRGMPRTMQEAPTYDDVVDEVLSYLRTRAAAAEAAGVSSASLAIDPGIGFGKTLEHNLELLRATPRLAATGYPVLVGLSRKRFLEALTGRAVEERAAASVSALTYCVLQGAAVMRVHDVAASRDAVNVAMALRREVAA